MNQKKESHLAKVLEKVPQAEFRPTTDPKSRKILDKKNPKDELANQMPYHEYLIMRGKMYKEKRANEAQNKDGQATDGCTFKPEILKKPVGNTTKGDLDGTISGGNKWEELYLQAQSKKAIDK